MVPGICSGAEERGFPRRSAEGRLEKDKATDLSSRSLLSFLQFPEDIDIVWYSVGIGTLQDRRPQTASEMLQAESPRHNRS